MRAVVNVATLLALGGRFGQEASRGGASDQRIRWHEVWLLLFLCAPCRPGLRDSVEPKLEFKRNVLTAEADQAAVGQIGWRDNWLAVMALTARHWAGWSVSWSRSWRPSWLWLWSL
jgi:hypothetical protein